MSDETEDVAELRRRLHLFHTALETMQVGVTITDARRRIVYANPAEAALHGCTVAELIGRDAASLAPTTHRRELSRDELRRVGSWQREGVNLRQDGTGFPVELLSDVVLDASGEPVGMVTTCQDITERKNRERALVESQERYSLAILGSNDAVWDWDLLAESVHFSQRWQEMLGLGDEPPGAGLDHWLGRVHGDDAERLRRSLDEHLAGRTRHFEVEHRVLHEDGSYRWVLARGVALRDEEGKPRRMGGSLTDITQRKVRDPLTDLPNRALLIDRLATALARQARHSGEVAVLFLDLDRFKLVNDSLGHPYGDQVLVAVARHLESCLRPGDTVARLGGDEFVVVLEEVLHPGDVDAVAERIHASLAAPLTLDGHEVYVSTSIGIALSRSGAGADDLVREADTAMYWAKASGRGQTRHFDEEMRTVAAEQLRTGNDLRHALERDELTLHYQPIVAASDRRVVGFEALLRWFHPQRGLLQPEAFLSAAEETGLIVPIGRWVRRQACLQLRAWQVEMGDGTSLFMSVNISPREVVHPEFGAHVLEVLEETGVVPGCLHLEVTERELLDRDSPAARALEILHDGGVRVAIDDFGTGYSALSYLDQLPVDVLKIDRSFIQDIDSLRSRSELVHNILRLAADLSIDVVAEGVERQAQTDHLTALACTFLQGFAHGEPMGEVDATRYLRRHPH